MKKTAGSLSAEIGCTLFCNIRDYYYYYYYYFCHYIPICGLVVKIFSDEISHTKHFICSVKLAGNQTLWGQKLMSQAFLKRGLFISFQTTAILLIIELSNGPSKN